MDHPPVEGAGVTRDPSRKCTRASKIFVKGLRPLRTYAVTAGLLGLSIALIPGQPIPAQETRKAEPSHAPAPNSNAREAAISSAVSQLVEQLRRHLAEPSKAADRVAGLYMIEVATGEVTLIADQPDAGITFCGSASWSNDGKRILFDAMRPEQVQLARMKAIELVAGELTMRDLGVGNCPTSSPDGGRIAFLLNFGGVPGAQGGVWLMHSDGSQRLHLGTFGRPRWSADGRQFMLIDFAIPAHVRLMDLKAEKVGLLQIPDLEIWSAPNWVSAGTIVAIVGRGWGYSIALIDVTDPAHGKVKEILWEMNFKGQGLDVNPHGPVYLASTGRCVFIGGTKEGMVLYSFKRGQAAPPKRLEPAGFDSLLQDVAFSPDGRFVLFTSNRAGPRQRGSAPRAGRPIPKKDADGKKDMSR
jgi:hypothetical protein